MVRKKVLIFLLWIVLPILLAEGFIRLCLFSMQFGFNLRRPELFADFADDDYTKLSHLFSPRVPPRPLYTPLLGWFTRGDPASLRHSFAEHVGPRRPVLLYGDSFAACYHLDECFEDRLNNSEWFSEGCYLLNYAVSSYGLDQIYLLMEKTVDLFEDPIVILSLTTIDLSRATQTFKGRPKPYFVLEEGRLRLSGVPVEFDPDVFISENPVRISSYLYRLVLHNRLVPRAWRAIGMQEAKKRRREEELARALLHATIRSLTERRIDFQFLVYGSRREVALPSGAPDRWRLDLIVQELESEGVSYISIPELIRARLTTNGGSKNDYFLVDDGHTNTKALDLAVEALGPQLGACAEQ